MAQMGFFDLSDRYASLDAKKEPLVEIHDVVPWDEFCPLLEQVWRKPESERKFNAGRKPLDAVLMFKTLVLSALYNLSDDQVEYQIRDPLSFMRFLDLGLRDPVPDAKPCGSITRRWRRLARWKICSSSLMGTWRGKALSRGAARDWMRPSCRCQTTTTRVRRTRRSGLMSFHRAGKTSLRNGHERTLMHAGPRNMAKVTMATRTM